MIVDSSALITLIQREPAAMRIADLLSGSSSLKIGTPTWTETAIVLSARYGPAGHTVLERVRNEFSIDVVGYTSAHAAVAIDAFGRFGKGRHPAALNFGDCMTYAVARLRKVPLLAVGDDFRRTDLHFESNGLVGEWV